ncbi:MAG: hypothetical protein QW522_04085, partial [Candidatus Methanomethyliaceae archaeon]
LKDWVIVNTATILVSILSLIFNKNPLEVFMILIFIESGIALILGGFYGAIFSSALFHDKIIRKKEFDKEEVKREVKIGKRFTILGFLLFVESIIIAMLI